MSGVIKECERRRFARAASDQRCRVRQRQDEDQTRPRSMWLLDTSRISFTLSWISGCDGVVNGGPAGIRSIGGKKIRTPK